MLDSVGNRLLELVLVVVDRKEGFKSLDVKIISLITLVLVLECVVLFF